MARARTGLAGRLRRFLGEERGSQFIELVFVMPLLIVLFMTTAELGRLFYTYSTLSKSINVGARYLSMADNTSAERDKGRNLVVCGNAAGCGGSTGFAPVVSCGDSAGT